jgi:putative tricarboxylic transport membrane protein
MTTVATVSILLFGLYLVKPLLYVLRIKHSVLMPVIFLMSVVGAYATSWRLFDVYSMLLIGIGAFFLRRKGYPMAPFVLGIVLGNLLDKSLRRGLVLTDGNLLPFFTRPICTVLAAVTIFTMLLYIPSFHRAARRILHAVTGGMKSLVARARI